ncbi:nucleotide-diphospho-sugar transferase [Cucurbitaria berberidis CBS 394.84]|uniref:UDP-N-acetylglucosamine diphosphorylase n=1 Tax=Cucurbitaria berberidis CBS 394.84 TaxID=1168544 RepID=A0A9P4GUI4_9PLEO|nr:nucleotide-diphospho-sugar transferase [Cucurbitaria berberidis CBS 394.84]KAF1851605.1 nucleotide-diphospho-sugar transferase [Cucurbitaria berberidis CBS 394.84]
MPSTTQPSSAARSFPTIKKVKTFITQGPGSGGDYHNVHGGHWLIDSKISTPMSQYEQYRKSRTSWGINVLGSFCVELEATDGSKGFATGFGGPPACWLVAEHFERFLIGQDPRDTNHLFEQMYRASMFYGRKGLPVAVISVIDLALWDLLGKIRNEPVYKMIGGATRERLNFYCTGPEPVAAKEMGFFGAKVPLPYGPGEGVEGLKKNVEFLTKHRESVGPDFPIMVDCYMSLNVPYTIEVVKATEHLNLNWWEECLSPDDTEGFEQIKRAHPRMKFTTGEHEFSRYGFRKLIEGRNLDILQPDVMWVGGLTELLKISAMASAYDIPVVPHASGPYSYHFVVSQANSPFQEYLANSPDGKSVLPVFGNLFLNEPIPNKGYLDVSQLDLPGFGLELNPNAGLIDATRILNPAPVKALKPAEEKQPEQSAETNGADVNGQLPRHTQMEAVKDTINTALEALHITGSKQGVAAKEPSEEQLNDLKSKYEKAGQEQVFSFYDKLSTAEKAGLFEQLSNFNPEYINEITERALHPAKSESESTETKLEPLPENATSSVLDSSQDNLDKWYNSGLDLIAENKVAVVLMAGGQGTRLGSSAPKGCFDIGLPSKKSLFQLQAERIAKVERLAAKKHGKESVTVPWYVMTSGPTRGPTAKYFEENNYFGLKKENVVIFEQGVLPCISNEGKILLESKSKVAVAPDGNGGLYQALIQSGVVQDMGKRGIQHIHAYCVDNCLVKVADPVFIGFSASKSVDIATKVVRKRNAKESVGLILQKNGKPDVVEYSEISTEDAEAKDSKDSELLKFRAANIVNHYYSFSFLESIPEWAKKLPHHVARKKIPFVNTETGETVKPEKPNGIKLEQFVFDCFPFLTLEKFACMEVKREDEFSPLKNARGTGEDDPDTSKQDILVQGKKWVQAAGATVVSEDLKDGIEVSPLISYGGEGLEFLKNRTIKAPAVIESED